MVSYKDNVEVGTATVKVKGIGYCSGTATGTFEIVPADLSGAEVTASSVVFDGSALEPTPKVTLGGRTLEEGADYEVGEYGDNTMPGTAWVSVWGVGNYAGSAVGSFRITEPFADVTPDTPHYEDILWLYNRGISTGWVSRSGVRTFQPYSNVARCDMAAFLYRLAGSPDYAPSAKDKTYFSDVDEDTPHCVEIWWLASQGISRGWDEKDGTHTFRPYANVARCDMAAFLYRLAGEPDYAPTAKERKYFSDIDADSPHAMEVWWLASTGVSAGWDEKGGGHTFRPYNNVARCDMAAFLHRMDNGGLVPMAK